MSVSKLPRWRVTLSVRQGGRRSRRWSRTVLGCVLAKDKDAALAKVESRWPTFWHLCLHSTEYAFIFRVVKVRESHGYLHPFFGPTWED